MREIVLALVTMCILSTPSAALLGRNIGGYLDLSAVQAEVDGVERQTLRQEYSVRFDKKLLPYVAFRSTIRFTKFDIDQTEAESAWREEFQPGGELIWKHPSFIASSSVLHRSTQSRNSVQGLVTDNLGLLFRTSDFRYPILSARYDWNRSQDPAGGADRDIVDRRLQAGVKYDVLGQSIAYDYTKRISENVISSLESTRDDHLLRWSNTMQRLWNDRLRLAASYRLNYSVQTDRKTASGKLLQMLSPATGLYGEDSSPDFGDLASTGALIDGNRSDPAEPEIDIGGVWEDRNIGADLGFEREVSAIYLYTDRASGSGPAWSVYGSEDNLTWELWTNVPEVEFNTGMNRYEILFDPRSARYVKLVKRGLNEISIVQVTEIELFEEIEETDSVTADWTSHYADFYSSLQIDPALISSVNLSYQHRPVRIGTDGRTDALYAVSTKHEPASWISQTARWQQDFQGLKEAEIPELTTNTASYSLELDPLETIGLLFSALNTINLEQRTRIRETNGLIAQVQGVAVPGLNLVAEVSRSRNNDYLGPSQNDTWRQRYSVDAIMTRSLQAAVQYTRQKTESQPADTIRSRQTYGIDLNYRLSRTILLRGSLNAVDDISDSISQDYFFSWRIMPKLTTTAQSYLFDPGKGQGTRRYSIHINYEIGPRTLVYLSFNRIDLSGAGGGETTSFQQGFRTTF